jgi:hypothetical protein
LNTIQIAISELKKKRDKILASVEAQVAPLNQAIAALEGPAKVTAPAKRKRGGWPKGKPRGKKVEKTPSAKEVAAINKKVQEKQAADAGKGASLAEAAS